MNGTCHYPPPPHHLQHHHQHHQHQEHHHQLHQQHIQPLHHFPHQPLPQHPEEHHILNHSAQLPPHYQQHQQLLNGHPRPQHQNNQNPLQHQPVQNGQLPAQPNQPKQHHQQHEHQQPRLNGHTTQPHQPMQQQQNRQVPQNQQSQENQNQNGHLVQQRQQPEEPRQHQLPQQPHQPQQPQQLEHPPQLSHQHQAPPLPAAQNGDHPPRRNSNNNQQYPWNNPNHGNTETRNNTRMTHGLSQATYHPGHMDDSDLMMDEQDYAQYQINYNPEEDEILEGMMTPRAVHQCNVCNKIFVSYKGLQQHAVIHTDQKPFRCDVCAKSFRFKSNLFEHRSVHSGFTPHACPYCGKTCRLKGNLKKHLRTHVTTKEELEAAWRPFASNRRPPADIPDDAIVVRGSGGPYYTPPPKIKKKRFGLGEPGHWVDKLRTGDLLPQVELEEKIRRLEDTIFNNATLERWSSLFEVAKSIAFETHDCPVCKIQFMTRLDCLTHHTIEHGNKNEGLAFFCEKCFRPFADESSFNQHMSYHTRVVDLINNGTIVPDPSDPDILVPTNDEFQMLFDGSVTQLMLEQQMM